MTYSAHAATHSTSKYELLSVCLLTINISERNELQGERERERGGEREGGGRGHEYNQSDGQAEIMRQLTGRQGDLF